MKVKNIDLKGLSLIHHDKTISFDGDGLSENLTDGVAKELAALSGYELVENKKPENVENKKPENKTARKRATAKETKGN